MSRTPSVTSTSSKSLKPLAKDKGKKVSRKRKAGESFPEISDDDEGTARGGEFKAGTIVVLPYGIQVYPSETVLLLKTT